MPGIMSEGSAARSGPKCEGRRRSRARRRDVRGRQRWSAGFRRGEEMDVIDRCLVVKGDGGDLLRHREDDMEVRHDDELGSSVVKPLGTGQRLALRAVAIVARVVRDALVATGIALLDMAAERSRATPFDRRHHATLRGR